MNIHQLFERHYPSLVWFLHGRLGDRDLAEDLAQEAFVRLIDKPPRAPDAWLYVVAGNLARDRRGYRSFAHISWSAARTCAAALHPRTWASRARSGGAMREHPSEGTLQALLDGELPPTRTMLVRASRDSN